ncbi:MAG: tetratricopeptide repeat protein, partial [Pseudomonadales bacterium]|nr:tetratricopeptide repeat protein [Pseudomonadales bacterium]
NQMTHSVEILETLLEKYPRDILALRIAHYLHFYVGTDADMKASVSRAFDIWQPGDPYYGFILGMYSFGCEEAGDYATAETCGRQAVEINRDDIWAAHSVAHVLQMQSRFREGISWCGDLLPGWTDANNFVNHLHWHKALQHIGAGEPEAALNIYDTWLEKPIADDFYLDVCNAAALLWRLEMLGLDVGNRWEAQREISARRACDDDLVFPTMHYLMAPIALGDEVAVDAALASLQHWASENTTQGEICQQVGLPLAEAMIEVRSGNRTEGATRIAAIADDIWKIGGSHAQRDLFSLIQNYYH